MEYPVIFPYSIGANRRLRTKCPDIIHVHHPFMLGRVGVTKARELGLPVVFTFHTQYWEHSHFFPVGLGQVQEWIKLATYRKLRHFLEGCDAIIVYTDTMRNLLVEKLGYQDRIQVVPSGIDLEPFQTAKKNGIREGLGWRDKQVMIAVGRLSAEKNWLILMDAVRRVIQTHPEFRLMLIGDGPQRAALEKYMLERGISQQVAFLGWIDLDEIPSFLKEADFFGFASNTETIGRATMEAMAAGLPIVAVNAPGTRDLVTYGCNGLLTGNDGASLASGIRTLLDNRELRLKFGMAAQETAKNFDVRIEAGKILDVYYNTIEYHRGTKNK
jgi:glycosyltransferase involved in cell wall biosynthesis